MFEAESLDFLNRRYFEPAMAGPPLDIRATLGFEHAARGIAAATSP